MYVCMYVFVCTCGCARVCVCACVPVCLSLPPVLGELRYGYHQFPFKVAFRDSQGKLLPLVYGGDPGTPGQADHKVCAACVRASMCV